MTAVSSCGSKEAPAGANPLLSEWDTPYGVPPFDKIKVSDYMPAFREAMKLHREEIKAIAENPEEPDFENTVVAFDNAGEMLTRVEQVFWSVAAADTNPQMQAVQEKVAPMLSEHYDGIMLDEKLFDRIRKVYEGRDAAGLDRLQKRLVEKVYKDFVRSGANLTAEQKAEFKEINSRLSELTFRFGKNLLEENARFRMVLNEEDVEGLPSGVRGAARNAAKEAGLGDDRYLFDIGKPSMLPFLSYSPRRDLRQELYTAYIEKCDHGDELDNKQLINEIIELRTRRANLLGYGTHAEYVLDANMAKTPENVYGLLDEIWTPALDRARGELAEMKELKRKEDGSDDFASWDWWYYAEKIRKSRYNLDQEALRPYFPLENVKQGIFELSNRLYGITFQPAVLPVYNNECVAYEVYDTDGSLLGILYMDLYPRAGRKGPGAWCGTFRDQSYKDGERVVPVVYIVANFTRPNGTIPALLDLDETTTFFHEFGHALHLLFSDVPYRGLLAVENDFVELPSQIMENWATEPEMLRSYAIHWQTGKVIPENLIKRIQESALFNQGFETVELAAASYSDMELHDMEEYVPVDLDAFEKRVLNEERGLIPQIEPRYRYPYFSHIFDGGYSAGYYGYLWAEVLDKDAYEAFRETGELFNKKVAARFREEILSKGGTEDGMVLYENFRGRQPSRLPLLVSRGLVEEPAANGAE